MKFKTIPYRDLRLSDDEFTNPRSRTGLDIDSLRELALDIGLSGLTTPLRVTASGVITAGQRRWHAIGMVIHWREELRGALGADEEALIEARAQELAAGVPTVLDEEEDPDVRLARSVADNLQREEMSSYEVAEQVVALTAKGKTQAWIGDHIGRDRTYVSKMLTAWNGACDELKVAWRDGLVPYARVKELAALPEPRQKTAVTRSGKETSPRGAYQRPGIEDLKGLLVRHAMALENEREPKLRGPKAEWFLRGFVRALRIATGEVPLDGSDALEEAS